MIRAVSTFAAVGTALALWTLSLTTTTSAARSCVPDLVSPEPAAILSQHRAGDKVETRWRFAWSSCPGATRYHLFVIGPNKLNPVVDINTLETTTYEKRATHFGISDRQGWHWKVRAFADGSWGDWSEARTFEVSEILAPPPAETCAIAGTVTGRLSYVVKDDRGQDVTFTLKEMFLKSSLEPQRIQRARIEGGTFRFENLTVGAEYRVSAANFRSDPRVKILTCQPNATYHVNFAILGPPPHE